MKNILFFLIIIFGFFLYFIPKIDNTGQYKVIGVIDGAHIYVDFNADDLPDSGELVKIKNLDVFPVKYSKAYEKYSKTHDIKEEDIYKLGYLQYKLTKDMLLGKFVKIDNNSIFIPDKNKVLSIYYNDADYSRTFLDLIPDFKLKQNEYFILHAGILHKPNCTELSDAKYYEVVEKQGNYKKCKTCFLPERKQKRSKKAALPDIQKFETGKIALFLNSPYEFQYPSPHSRSSACIALINEINDTKKSIDFALYGISGQKEIIDALIKAKARGVSLRGVFDSNSEKISTYPDSLLLVNYADLVFDNSQHIMHNKFFIFDDKLVFTGSMNISDTGCGGYNSNSVVVIDNSTVVNAYKNEFEQMHNNIFKTQKKDYSTPFINLDDDTKIKIGFSPAGDIYNNIISKEIKSAKSSIRISIFVLSHPLIVKDLINAKKRGVNIWIIADATSAIRFSRYIKELRQNGIQVKVENWGGKNHEKTLLVDEKTLIIGSANFSKSGSIYNDENIVVIKNKKMGSFYADYFDKLYDRIDNKYLYRFPAAEGLESGNSCHDGIDNDFDGDIDLNDAGCKK